MIDVNMRDAMRRTTLHVKIRATGQREMAVRVFVATRLIRLAALVLGCGVSFEDWQ